jgi:hypothetical protein
MSMMLPNGWTPANGTYTDNLAEILKAEGVPAVYTFKGHPSHWLLSLVREKRPAIVHIKWQNGGGHFVVCKKVYADGTMIFLDPASGLVEVAIEKAPAYKEAAGRMSGDLVFTGIS